MASLREAVSESLRGFVCAAAQVPDPFRNWLSGTTSGIPGVGGFIAGSDAVWDSVGELVCSDTNGGTGGGNPPVYPPIGFEPGQCELVPYLFEWEYTQASGTRTTQTIDALLGPIGDFVLTQNSSGNTNVDIECRGAQGLPPLPPGSTRRLLSNQSQSNIDPVILSLTRKDGLPDDCGPAEPQQPPTGDDIIDYDGPDGNPRINIPITINPSFPITLPSGTLVVPFTVITPTVTLSPRFNLSTGDITFNIGGQEGSTDCCPPIDPPDEEGQEEGDPDPPADDLRLWGVKVRTAFNPAEIKATRVFDSSEPSLWVPRLASVRFAIEIGGVRGWSQDMDVKTQSEIIRAPSDVVAYDVKVNAIPGVTAVLSPIYLNF